MKGSRLRKNKCSIVNSNIFIFHFKLGKRLNLKLLMILQKHASIQRKKASIEKYRFTLLTVNRFFELNNKFRTESSISVFVNSEILIKSLLVTKKNKLVVGKLNFKRITVLPCAKPYKASKIEFLAKINGLYSDLFYVVSKLENSQCLKIIHQLTVDKLEEIG